MFTFAAGLYDSLFRDPERTVLMVGPATSGKTTLFEQLKVMYHPTAPSTAGEAPAATAAAAATEAASSSSHTNGLSSLGQHLRAAQQPQKQQQQQKQKQQHNTISSPVAAGVARKTKDTFPSAPVGKEGGGAVDPPPTNSGSGGVSPYSIPPAVLPAKLLPGTARPAPAEEMLHNKRIKPTVGLNYARLRHYFSPPPLNANDPRVGEADAVALNPTRTALALWDLGGQASLQSLWPNYYSAAQAVVFVVDSAGPFFGDEGTADAPVPAAEDIDRFFLPQREKLRELVRHPLLRGAVFLVLSNKADRSPRLSLAHMQAALGLVDLALEADAYAAAAAPDAVVGSAESSGGFGAVRLRLCEVSALSGAGIAESVDWLVLQLLHSAREVQRPEQ